ncbi:MAG: hypothetical protein AB7S74_18275 [Hyphomicrobium sp.]
MDVLPNVRIVRDAQTGGYGLSVYGGELARPLLLLPLRYGKIFFAETLTSTRILIVAEDRRESQFGYWAIVDLGGQIVSQSEPFRCYGSPRFYLSNDHSVALTAEPLRSSFMCWDVSTLTLSGSGDCLRVRGQYLEFDSYRNYFDLGTEVGAIRQFHSPETEIEFNRLTQSGLLIPCYNLRPFIGQTADGSLVFQFKKGEIGSLHDDGFLLVSPSTLRATRSSTYGRIVKGFAQSHHEAIESHEFEHLASRAATITLVLADKSYESYIHTLESLSSTVKDGIDAYRFGYVLRVRFMRDNRPLSESAVLEELTRSRIDDFQFGTDYGPRITVALASIIRNYVSSAKTRIDAWDKRGWICDSVKSLKPALYILVRAFLKLGPEDFDDARDYVALLGPGFNSEFLELGSPYFGHTEPQLRIAIFCQLHRDHQRGWNDFHILDNAAKHHGAANFLEMFEDELRRWSLSGATLGDQEQTRQRLADSLREDFDCELRRLLAAEKSSCVGWIVGRIRRLWSPTRQTRAIKKPM